jgi:hypothetical protein
MEVDRPSVSHRRRPIARIKGGMRPRVMATEIKE